MTAQMTRKESTFARSGFALAEILIIVVLAGALLGLSLAVHALQPGASGQRDHAGPSPSAAGVSIHGFSISCARNTALLRDLSGSAWLCDLATGRNLPFALPFDRVTAVAQSENGNLLVAGYRDGTLAIGRDAQPNVTLIEGEHSTVTALVCSPDGALIVSGDGSGRIRASNSDGTRHWQRQGHAGRAEWLALSPKMDVLASAGADGEIRLWKVASGECLRTLTGHGWKVTRMAFTGDGKLLISGSLDRTIRLWDVQSGRTLWTSPLQESPVLGLACAPNDAVFVTSSCYQGAAALEPGDASADCRTGRAHRSNSVPAVLPRRRTAVFGGVRRPAEDVAAERGCTRVSHEDGTSGDAQCVLTIGAELTRRTHRVRAARWLFQSHSAARIGARRPL